MQEILVRIVCEDDLIPGQTMLIQNVTKEVGKHLSPKTRHTVSVNVRKCTDDAVMKEVYSKSTIL